MMTLQETEAKVRALEMEKLKLEDLHEEGMDLSGSRQELEKTQQKLLREAYANLSAYDHVYLARKSNRPNIYEYINDLFEDFIEMHGDRLYGDDGAILGGIAFFQGQPVTVIGHVKGKNLAENLYCNFGMPQPEGYRKAMRLMKQAEKFGRPIITFIDTPGAYPGIEAEEHGQGEAIARSLMEMSQLKVPVIAIIIGEGGSGGALALAVADQIWMLQYAVFSIASPEGFASILWKDASRAQEACEVMKLTAQDLLELGIIDRIIAEPKGDWGRNKAAVMEPIRRHLSEELTRLGKLSTGQLLEERYSKYRNIGRAGYDR